MDMFNNVTSTMTNWWGKGGKKPDENEKKEEEKQSEPVVTSETGEAEEVKEGDEPRADSPAGEKSPPTSEADSVSIASQPEEIPEDDGKEKVSGSSSGFGGIAVDIEEVSSKAFQSAKNLGNFLFSVGKKAGKTVTDTAKHLKHTVEENETICKILYQYRQLSVDEQVSLQDDACYVYLAFLSIFDTYLIH